MTVRHHPLRRAVIVAAVGAALILGGGWLSELWRFGATTETSYVRVEHAVMQTVDDMVTSLERTALEIASDPDVLGGLDAADMRAALFQAIRAAVARPGNADVSVTVYDAAGSARAWAGRPSEIPSERILAAESLFVAPGPLGLRLVHVLPLRSPGASGTSRRIGSLAAERVLSPAGGITDTAPDAYRIEAAFADVALRTVYEGAGTSPGPFTIEVFSPSGELLLVGEVRETDLIGARSTWRRAAWALTLAFLAFALAVGCAPLIVRPPRGLTARDIAIRVAVAGAGCVIGYGLLRTAVGLSVTDSEYGLFDSSFYRSVGLPALLRAPADLFLVGLLLVGLFLVAAFLVDQVRLARRPAGRHGIRPGSPGFLVAHIVGGTAVTALLVAFNALVSDTFNGATVDLVYTSVYPWDSARLALLGGVLLASAAVVWSCATLLLGTQFPWRVPHRQAAYLIVGVVAWTVPGAILIGIGAVPTAPVGTMLVGAVALAVAVPYLRPRFRHGSHAARVLAVFLVALFPILLAYPSLLYHSEQTKQRFVETRYAVQAATHPEQLQAQLTGALGQIDAIAELATLTQVGPAPASNPDTDRAFLIWRQTDLAGLRLTSAVELYGAGGRLTSRFALNFPEYAGRPSDWQVTGCEWEVYGEIAPFGSDERRVLHAERALCSEAVDRGDGHTAVPTAGAVVVHVALDYRTLPFISSANPYTELLRPLPLPNLEGSTGQDVEIVIYGWGLQPLFSSGGDAWSLGDGLFERIYSSREPFWMTLEKGGQRYATFVANNRVGIYLLGYPVFGVFDHFVHLAELSALAGLLFAFLGVVVGVGSWFIPNRYRFGRALLREVRTSFYRRLLLAFIAATLIPVLALAFVIRGYFTAQLRADVEAGAARTAAIAQRVIEESFVLQQVGEEATALINDDLLVWISQVLDQEINIFNGSQLVATSERDLFASGLLPTRTPGAVYSAVVLDRLPSYVIEDSLASLQYLVAATPIRSAGRDAILTVPLASRQQEIEQQIADLDRGLLLGVVIFVLLGAGSGLYMAERIADPVKRLTRATGKIARGDFDAQVAAHSADELQQLVSSFNQMAVDLKDQQVQLEKTHRLEAWADMARQVAHEIKNPLTPVQLSAEHLLRVHADRGEPLGSVVQSCVESILTQVRLLRQISSEFSSYATSPVVQLRPTAIRDLVTEVIGPYLVGLEQRISVSVDIPEAISELSLDRTLVGRALTNVIENALHAMPGKGTLDIRAVQTPEAIAVEVADSGVGLDADTLQRIFEPYFSTKVSGTGLGMAIAKRNVELSGGTIRVESEKDRGTTVTLTFPLRLR